MNPPQPYQGETCRALDATCGRSLALDLHRQTCWELPDREKLENDNIFQAQKQNKADVLMSSVSHCKPCHCKASLSFECAIEYWGLCHTSTSHSSSRTADKHQWRSCCPKWKQGQKVKHYDYRRSWLEIMTCAHHLLQQFHHAEQIQQTWDPLQPFLCLPTLPVNTKHPLPVNDIS